MAINYNINPYQAGAVVIDNRPYVQFFQQQMAQRQAKQEALDNYFRDLGKNITPAGVRNQDVEGLMKRTNEWRQMYIQNKNEILHPELDGGKKYTEYMSRYQDQQAYIERSKARLNLTNELGKLKLDPNKSYMLDDPDLMDKMHYNDLPLDHPDSKELNLMELATPPKPIGTKELEAHRKYITGGLVADEKYGPTQYLPEFKTLTPVTSEYNLKSKQMMGQRGMNEYDASREWRIQSNKLFNQMAADPVLHNQLNSTFKSVYGKDIETPREARAAQDILDNSASSVTYKPGEDVYGRERAMENVRFGHEKELKKEGNVENSWVPQYIGRRMSEADAKEEIPIFEPNKLYSPTFVKELSPDPVLMKGLSREGIEPNRVYKTKDGKIWPIFWKYKEDFDANGKKIGTSLAKDQLGNPEIDWDLSNKMDLDQAYLSLGYKGQTKKQLGGTMQETYNKPEEKKQPASSGNWRSRAKKIG